MYSLNKLSHKKIEESQSPSKIHTDIKNFEHNTKDPSDWYKQIPHLFRGKPLELNEEKQSVIVITGISAAGKDRVIDETANAGVPWAFATTGTSRSKRPDETDDKYIWFRPQNQDETWGEYKRNIYDEYGLIEADEHYGNFYGLPLESLQKVMQQAGVIPLIRTDVNGALSIQAKLADLYNIVVITVLPDSLNQMHEEVRKRALAENKDPELRILEDLKKLELYPTITNFYLLNSRLQYQVGEYDLSGLELSINAIMALLEDLNLMHIA